MSVAVQRVFQDVKLESNMLAEVQVNNLGTFRQERAQLKFLPVSINDNIDQVHALVDTGCTATCISKSLADTLALQLSPAPKARVSGAFTGASSQISGLAKVKIGFRNVKNDLVSLPLNALVVDNLSHPVFLGLDILSGAHMSHISNSALFLQLDNIQELPFIPPVEVNFILEESENMEFEETF